MASKVPPSTPVLPKMPAHGVPPPPPVVPPRLSAVTQGLHPCTSGEPASVALMSTSRTILRSANCYYFQDTMEARKQLKMKTKIRSNTDDTDTVKKFSRDEKNMTVEEITELAIDHMEFCGIDSDFYLPDHDDPSHLCYILRKILSSDQLLWCNTSDLVQLPMMTTQRT